MLSGKARTGIDLGTGSIKLVRVSGGSQPVITHLGVEPWDPGDPAHQVTRVATSLRRLLHRLRLSAKQLGTITVGLGGDDVSLREVLMPLLSPEELKLALPFESRRHLYLRDVPDPILDAQILGPAETPASEPARAGLAQTSILEERDPPPPLLTMAAMPAPALSATPSVGATPALSATPGVGATPALSATPGVGATRRMPPTAGAPVAQTHEGTTERISEPPQMRVLIVATPKSRRDVPLAVLARVGLMAQVVDAEPLAALNVLLWLTSRGNAAEHSLGGGPTDAAGPGGHSSALALADVGHARVALHLTHRTGGLLSRSLGPPPPASGELEAMERWSDELAAAVQETLLFYRGRYRREVPAVYLSGGGALIPGLPERLERSLGREVLVCNPFLGMDLAGRLGPLAGPLAPRFVTACGLCRWWE